MSRMDKHPERRNKATLLFDVDTAEVNNETHTNIEDNADSVIKQLDHLMQKELRTWWDFTTLNSYLDKKLIHGVCKSRISQPQHFQSRSKMNGTAYSLTAQWN